MGDGDPGDRHAGLDEMLGGKGGERGREGGREGLVQDHFLLLPHTLFPILDDGRLALMLRARINPTSPV